MGKTVWVSTHFWSTVLDLDHACAWVCRCMFILQLYSAQVYIIAKLEGDTSNLDAKVVYMRMCMYSTF